MSGLVETAKKECPDDGGDGKGGMDENDNKQQAVQSATKAKAVFTVKVDINDPPPKRQRIEEPVQNAGSHNNGQKQQQRDGKKTSKKKIKTKHMDPRILKVRKTIQEGCRTNNLASAMEAYEDALKQGIRIEAQSYYNLLNLCGGLDREERKVHVGTPKQYQSQPQQKTQVSEPKNDGDKTKNSENIDASQAASNTVAAAVVIDSKQRQEYIFAIKERMQSKEVNLSLNETAYSAIVKILSKNKEFRKAEEILDEAEGVQQCKPKLRLYASLLHAYCDDERLVEALRCWKRLRQRSVVLRKKKATRDQNGSSTSLASFGADGMDVTEREYLSLLRCAVRTSARNGGEYLENGSDLVMEDVLTRLAEDIPVPAKDTVAAIIEWFEIQNNNIGDCSSCNSTEDIQAEQHSSLSSQRMIVKDLLAEIRSHDSVSEPSPRMGPVTIAEKRTTWTISKTISIDRGTGRLLNGCLEGYKLDRVPLSDRSFCDMTTMNESIVQIGNIEGNAHCKFQGGRKGKKRNDFSPEDRRNEWNRFESFLEHKTRVVGNPSIDDDKCTTRPIEQEPYEVVIDGANIGYFNQSFASAPKHVDYEQIDWVVRYFTDILGKRVLLVMHHRHFTRHMLPNKYRGLYESWINTGILYKTPPGMNDDWFWMHAALKYKALVVTNDEMRDHQFQMLAPKFFLRWKERHQVYFDFGTRDNNDKTSDDSNRVTCNDNIGYSRHYRGRRPLKVILTFPNLYSRRIQRVADGLVVPLTKRGDENRFLDGYHVASDNEPDQELYLCVRPKIAASISAKTTTDSKDEDNDAMMENEKPK